MQVLGQVLVLASFGLTAVVAALSVSGAATGERKWVRASGFGIKSVAWLNGAVALVLLHGFLTHDFSNQYVSSYSDSGMPLLYLFAAFWAGEKGALLFWVLVLSIAGAIMSGRLIRSRDTVFDGTAGAVTAIALLFFELLMVYASNPFETYLTFQGPADGSGMNPLLQNPLMAIHPPLQLAGFVAYTIPFAFAIGALVAGRSDGSWITVARPWNLFAWTMLTAGLLIGGLWAYLELGWGGFWGWDPVENAALLPWLSGTALLHSSATERRRGMFRRWNFFLVILTFVLTIFATFLTRSQLIASLHSFANSVLTPYFMYYMFVIVLVSGLLLAWRYSRLAPAHRIESLWSRESMVVMNQILFMLALFIVLWGTLLPKLSESPAIQASINAAIDAYNSLTGAGVGRLEDALVVGPEWFNKVISPIGLLILALTAIGPMLPYRTADRRLVRRKLGLTAIPAIAVALAVSTAFVLSRATRLTADMDVSLSSAVAMSLRSLSLEGVYGFLGVLFAAWLLATASLDYFRSLANNVRITGNGRLRAAVSLFRTNPGRFGGDIVHAGLALCFLGFAGSAGKLERKDIIMQPMESMALGGSNLVFLGTSESFVPKGGFARVVSDILVHDRHAPLPEAALSRLKAIPGVKNVVVGEGSTADLEFGSTDEAVTFFARAFARTTLKRDLEPIRVDRSKRVLYLSPKEPAVLKVLPRAFNRYTKELGVLASAADDGAIEVRRTRGDPVLMLKFEEAGLFESVVAGLMSDDEPAFVAVAPPGKDDVTVRVVASGVGRLMRPEVRFYLKFESPTSEVDIDSNMLYDLYVAAMPGMGSSAVNVSAMLNPLMSWLWVGSTIVLVFGLLLVLPGRNHRRERMRRKDR